MICKSFIFFNWQAKEKLIASLRQGSDSSSDNVSPTLLSELEEAKQERDLLRDELQQNKYKMEQLRTEYLVSKRWIAHV